MNYEVFSRPLGEKISIGMSRLLLSNKKLISINLAVSNACGADCMFCPDTKKKWGMMSMQLVKKIADEVASGIGAVHDVRRFSVGENGDALLNTEFIEILRYLKKSNPNVSVSINTNFQYFTKEISEVVVKEGLIDEVMVNIDGHDEGSYYKMKRIPYRVVEQNILDFLEVRGKIKVPLTIICLTFDYYHKKIINAFGIRSLKDKNIIKFKGFMDDFELIKQNWKDRIESDDKIVRSTTFGWAEREMIKNMGYDHSRFGCSQMKRILHECFIAPNGDWYACCFDEKQQLVLGNINENSIDEIYHGVSRGEFVRKLKNREYENIGYPCSLVESCQTL